MQKLLNSTLQSINCPPPSLRAMEQNFSRNAALAAVPIGGGRHASLRADQGPRPPPQLLQASCSVEKEFREFSRAGHSAQNLSPFRAIEGEAGRERTTPAPARGRRMTSGRSEGKASASGTAALPVRPSGYWRFGGASASTAALTVCATVASRVILPLGSHLCLFFVPGSDGWLACVSAHHLR